MSASLTVVVLILAIVLFLAAAWGVTNARRPIALGWIGLALVTLVPLVGAFKAL